MAMHLSEPSMSTTEPSCGASACAPARGFRMVLPCTSWSYSRMMGSRETMAKSPITVSRDLFRSLSGRGWPVSALPGVNTDSSFLMGASCSLELSRQQTSSPLCQTFRIPVSSEWPRTVSSVWKVSASFRSSGRSFSSTAMTMRSWDSDRKISQEMSPGSLRGALSRKISPPVTESISPAAEEKPPAPQSVMKTMRPRSRASRMKSSVFFSSIGLPICTAVKSSSWEASSRAAEENVAPLRPSRPVRPPMTMTLRPGRISFRMSPRGITPAVPQKTRGL